MATPQLSPGVIVREVDLTVGRSENVLDNIGAIAGPFTIGPVEEVINITSEQELIKTFGKPLSTDFQYEYWMSASSYLSYGGILKVVRADDDKLTNSRVGFNTDATVKIKNFDNYNNQTTGNYHFAAKTPGTWANGLKVCVIDNKADQIIGINTDIPGAVEVGYGVTTPIDTVIATSIGTTEAFTGYLKGIITGINTTANTIDVKIVSRVSLGGTETQIEYSQGTQYSSIITNSTVGFADTDGSSLGTATVSSVKDWYDEQTLDLANSTLYWKSIAPKPITTQYASSRNCKNDAINIVVIDDDGTLTGIQGNILEKHISLSKATDAISGVNSPQKIWYKNYLANFSNYVYSGTNYYTENDNTNNVEPVATGFTKYSGIESESFNSVSVVNGGWNKDALNTTFNAIGNKTFTLTDGHDYGTGNGAAAELGKLMTAYELFSN